LADDLNLPAHREYNDYATVWFTVGPSFVLGSSESSHLSRLRTTGRRTRVADALVLASGDCSGYDLTGNVSGVCPECGTPVERPVPEET